MTRIPWVLRALAGAAVLCVTQPGCPDSADDDAADDDGADDDATGDDDVADDDDATGDDDTADDDDSTGDDDDSVVDAPALEDLGGYLSVLYTHLVLPVGEQVLADAGGRFYTYLGGTDPGSFEHMEIDSCEYFGPGSNSTFGDLSFSPRTAGDVSLWLDGSEIPLYPGTSEEDGAPIYQNGGMTPGVTHQFDAWYGVEASGGEVPAFSFEAGIHVPPDAEPTVPALADGWLYTGAGDFPVSWSGSSDGEVRLTLSLNEQGTLQMHEVLCRWMDDGEQAIPAEVLAEVPAGGFIRTGSMERKHTLYHPLPDGTVLETYGSNLYVFDWQVAP